MCLIRLKLMLLFLIIKTIYDKEKTRISKAQHNYNHLIIAKNKKFIHSG